jgi:FixJ family two-component response regulator
VPCLTSLCNDMFCAAHEHGFGARMQIGGHAHTPREWAILVSVGVPVMNAQVKTLNTVYILDDDFYVRQGLENLLQSLEFNVVSFASVPEFFKNVTPDARGCLVLDVRLPGLSGLDLQAELKRLNIEIPIVFITGHGDIPMTVRAMRAGAVEFLTKPIREHELLDAVHLALKRDHEHREAAIAAADVRARFDTLSARERDVVALVVSGKMNKQIAAALGVSEVTVNTVSIAH